MFFDKTNLSVTVLDVIELNQNNINISNSNRNFYALSFRYSANTVLLTDEETYKLTDNSLCFVPALLPYKRVASTDKLIVVHFYISNYSFNKIETFITKNPEKYKELFYKIRDCWHGKENGYEYESLSLFYQILSLCFKDNTKPTKSINIINASIEFMESNFNNPHITMEEIAKKSFISTVYFRKLFKKHYGISPIKYIINLRIEYAVNLMQTGYYSLYEVAKLCGYNDYSYFSSEFKKIKGVSPSDFHYYFNSQI